MTDFVEKHDHEHDHHHHHDVVEQKDKNMIWLNYTLEHNIHHTEEMSDFASQLKEQGKTELAEAVFDAAEAYEHANELLKDALEKCD